jgi:hypothetical protein
LPGRILLPFADGVYAFALWYGQLHELQEKTDAGPLVIYNRVLSGTWRYDDVRETIRLALIGGGEGWVGADLGDDGQPTDGAIPIKVTDVLANKLVRRYVDTYGADYQDPDEPPVVDQPLPWTSSAFLAAQILGAGLSGVKDEPLGKKTSEEVATTPSLTENGDGLVFSQPSPTGDGSAPT